MNAEPFDCLQDLRVAHDELLGVIEAQASPSVARTGSAPQVLARIVAFVDRAAITGTQLDEHAERSAAQVLTDYWCKAAARYGGAVLVKPLAEFRFDALPLLPDEPAPYVGLESFDRQRAIYFRGRRKSVDELHALVRQRPFVMVVGASGCGKSSLVRAGLLPRLDETGPGADRSGPRWRVAEPFTPGSRPLRRLAGALESLGLPGGASRLAERLASEPGAVMRELPQQPPALLIVDQAEELFTLGEATAVVFARALAEFLGGSDERRVLFTLREEFRERMASLTPLQPWSSDERHRYRLAAMTHSELCEAIREPALQLPRKLFVHPEVVRHLADAVADKPAALPLLQYALRSLWRSRQRNRITLQQYEEIERRGGPLCMLRDDAEQLFEKADAGMRDAIERIMTLLIHVDDMLDVYREPVSRPQLERAVGALTEPALDRLAQADLLRIARHEGEDWVEIKHEALIGNWPRLDKWIENKRGVRRAHIALRQAAQGWIERGRPADALLKGWQLDAAQGLLDSPGLQLEPFERDFIEVSTDVAKAESEAMRRRLEQEVKRGLRLKYTVFVLAILALVELAAIVPLWWWGRDTELRVQAAVDEAAKAARQGERALRDREDSIDQLIAQVRDLDRQLGTARASAPAASTPAEGSIPQPVATPLVRGAEPARSAAAVVEGGARALSGATPASAPAELPAAAPTMADGKPPAVAPVPVAVAPDPSIPAASAPASAVRAELSRAETERRVRALVYRLENGVAPPSGAASQRMYPISWAWAMQRAKSQNLRQPLSLAVLFDTAVAHGPMQAATMRALAARSPGDIDSERDAVLGYLERRRGLADTAQNRDLEPDRISELTSRVTKGDWTLELPLPADRPK